MKKFLIVICLLIAMYTGYDYCRFYLGWYIDFAPNKQTEAFVKTEDDRIKLKQTDKFENFEIKGVDLGSGIPGEWTTDYAIDKDTYLRWFKQIQEMGTNTIRVYSVQSDVFYNAYYEYNINSDKPLYLLQGVAVNDYIQNSHRDAYDREFRDEFLYNCRVAVDVIHGNKKISLGRRAISGSGNYNKDVSQWTIGYIFGIDWETTFSATIKQVIFRMTCFLFFFCSHILQIL